VKVIRYVSRWVCRVLRVKSVACAESWVCRVLCVQDVEYWACRVGVWCEGCCKCRMLGIRVVQTPWLPTGCLLHPATATILQTTCKCNHLATPCYTPEVMFILICGVLQTSNVDTPAATSPCNTLQQPATPCNTL